MYMGSCLSSGLERSSDQYQIKWSMSFYQGKYDDNISL